MLVDTRLIGVDRNQNRVSSSRNSEVDRRLLIDKAIKISWSETEAEGKIRIEYVESYIVLPELELL